MSKIKKYTVYLPCSYTEVYKDVEAASELEAIAKAYNDEAQCWGEITTNREHEGDRAEGVHMNHFRDCLPIMRRTAGGPGVS